MHYLNIYKNCALYLISGILLEREAYYFFIGLLSIYWTSLTFQKYHPIYRFIINEQSIADIIGLEGVLGWVSSGNKIVNDKKNHPRPRGIETYPVAESASLLSKNDYHLLRALSQLGTQAHPHSTPITNSPLLRRPLGLIIHLHQPPPAHILIELRLVTVDQFLDLALLR